MNRRTWLLIVLVALAALAMSSVASAGLLTNSASSVATDVSAQAPSNQNDPLATQPNKDDPFGIRNFNCADIAQYGIDKQMNVRAAAIMAKCSGKSEGNTNSGDTSGLLAPLAAAVDAALPALGGTDKDIILPDGTYPATIESETFTWGHGSTVVVNYNDLRTNGSCFGGLAYSTDGGATWHATSAICSGHGTNYGDPAVVYNASFNKWFATDLASGCGGFGMGGLDLPRRRNLVYRLLCPQRLERRPQLLLGGQQPSQPVLRAHVLLVE